MPKKSHLTLKKDEALQLLEQIRPKIHYNTYNAYVDNIYDTRRKDTVDKIIYELSIIPKMDKIKNITKKDIKNDINAFVNEITTDKFSIYERRLYTFKNVRSLEDFFKNIISKIKGGDAFVSFFVRNPNIPKDDKEKNKVKVFSINSDYFKIKNMNTESIKKGFEKFKERFNEILEKIKSNAGGTYELEAGDEVMYDQFAISEVAPFANGKSKSMIFKTHNIEESMVEKRDSRNRRITVKRGDCVFQCLTRAGFNIPEEEIENLRNIDYLKNYIDINNLNIDIICNSFTLKKSINLIFDTRAQFEIYDKKNRMFLCSKLELSDINVIYLNKSPNAQYTIVYDDIDNHCDLIDGELRLDDISITYSRKVVKNGEIIFTAGELIKNDITYVDNTEVRYLFFDYETVVDFTNSCGMNPYSLSILDLTDNQLKQLEIEDKRKNIEYVNQIRASQCRTFLGFDCTYQFIDWIMANQNNKKYIFIGFNNSNFDNFIFLHGLLRYQKTSANSDYSVSNIFYNGNQILNFMVNGRHETFDIHKHLVGSLASNCDSYKINCCAKKTFDHDLAQKMYLEGELLNYINGNDELKDYNEFDVLATAVLYQKYRLSVESIKPARGYADKLYETKTVGSLVYNIFKNNIKQKGIKLPKLTIQHYQDMQRSKIAGRVECFGGECRLPERIASIDVCSLYPYVMAVKDVYYPCGEIVYVEQDQYINSNDKLGFWYVDFDQSNLKAKNLPNIYAFKTGIENNWAHEGIIENYLLSNVMIDLLLKYECKVTIKNGFYFTEKRKSCEMFDFILQFMGVKNHQDTLKANKDPEYNSALRETTKLMMNSLSGKVIEGLHTEKTECINTYAQYQEIKNKSKTINTIDVLGKKIFVNYTVDEEEVCAKSQRPIYLGILIYDFAKTYMYEYGISKIGKANLTYTDTDSLKIRYKHFEEWKELVDTQNIQVPHWAEVEAIDPRYANHKIYEHGSKVLGSFEDENQEYVGKEYLYFVLQKKTWLYAVDSVVKKSGFKGISNRCLLLNSDDIKDIKDKSKLEVYQYNINNPQLSVGKNQIELFEQVYKNKSAYVLCPSFRRVVKNTLRDVDIGDDHKYNKNMNTVQLSYIVKKISIK
jgi:hypothetical protein